MGYKKIEEKRKELNQKIDVKNAFLQAAYALDKSFAELKAATARLENTRSDVARKVEALQTDNIPEFAAYKKQLLESAWSGTPPPSIMPVEKLVNAAEKEVQVMIAAWEDKLAQAFPKDVGAGMTFKDQKMGRIYEVKSGPEQAGNKNLKGDAAVFFKTEFHLLNGAAGSSLTISLEALKKMKYLKV